MDTWVIWNMTGGVDGGLHVTDPTNASRTMLMDLDTLSWDADIAEDMGIPLSMLPEIRSCSEVYGEVRERGVLHGVPVAGILGDQQAATFGQACLAVGEAKNTYGTGNFMLINTGTQKVPSKNGLLTTVCYKIGDQPTVYALEGAIAVTGSLVQWVRDNIGPDRLGAGDRDAGQDRRGQRRRVLRAGVLGPLRPVLARPTPAARSSASPGTSTRGTSPARRWRPRPSRARSCSTR